MKKKPTLRGLKNKAWKLFSEWVRRKDSDEGGTCVCVTCRTPLYWKDAQAGHFVGGRTNAVLFHPDLVHVQCVACNIFRGGNYAAYTLFMLDRYGREKVEEFLALKHKVVKYTRSDLEELIADLKSKLENLEREQECHAVPQ
jgi:hypothetical protein